jgi:hypothetical protein
VDSAALEAHGRGMPALSLDMERSQQSGLRSRLLAIVVTASVGLALVLVDATSAHAAERLPTPVGFKLRASDGYTLSVIAFEDARTERGIVLLLMRSRRAHVFYSVKASVGPTSIEADLGAIGRIDVDFVPSGQSRTERSLCGDPIQVDSGRYEGTIDLEGEEGYSEVHAISARGDATLALNFLCPGGPKVIGYGGHSPGALLTVKQRPRQLEFTAMKNSPTRPARFTASISERRNDMAISRSVYVTAAPRAFDFDVPSGTALATPPMPFAGDARYIRSSGKGTRWRGDLSVDFPGHAGVRLTGPGAHASLMRIVLNPSHPFRLRSEMPRRP